MKYVCYLSAIAAVFGSVTIGGTGKAVAEEFFVPKGHTYSYDSQNLPSSNSRKYNIITKADVIESEIYRKQREKRMAKERVNRFIDRDRYHVNGSYIGY